jgi:hypothetical protein
MNQVGAWSHPQLVGKYRELYRRGAHLPLGYREILRRNGAQFTAKYGLVAD